MRRDLVFIVTELPTAIIVATTITNAENPPGILPTCCIARFIIPTASYRIGPFVATQLMLAEATIKSITTITTIAATAIRSRAAFWDY